MSNHNQHDSEDKRDMDAVSRAYRDARDRDADHMAPPAALDDAIRAAARRAVHAGPQPVGKSWIRQWTPQLAVAAVVVLSVSVVFVAIEEKPELAPAPIQKMTQARRADAPAAEMAPRETKDDDVARPATMTAGGVKKKAGVDTGTATGGAQAARQMVAPLVKEERGAALPMPPSLPPQLAAAAPAMPASAPHLPLAPPPAAAVANLMPAPFPATIADAVAPARKEARADARSVAVPEPKAIEEKIAALGAVRSRDAMDAPPTPAVATVPATATPAAPVAIAQAPMRKQLAPAPAATVSAGATVAPERTPLLDAARGNTQAPGNIDANRETFELPGKSDQDDRPGPWLKRLRELREQGKLKELREEIARFKKRHPDVVLPKTLAEMPAE